MRRKVDKGEILSLYNLGFNFNIIHKVTGYCWITIKRVCESEGQQPKFEKLTEEKKRLIKKAIEEEKFSLIPIIKISGCSGEVVLEYLYELSKEGEIDISKLFD